MSVGAVENANTCLQMKPILQLECDDGLTEHPSAGWPAKGRCDELITPRVLDVNYALTVPGKLFLSTLAVDGTSGPIQRFTQLRSEREEARLARRSSGGERQ